MADKYIPGQEFASWTSVPGGGGGLGTVAAAYLAHKAGLIDLNNKEQMNSIQKNGVLGHVAMKALDGAVKPPANVNAPVNPNVTVGGPMNQSNIEGVPLPAMPSIPTPSSGNAGMDSQMSSFPEPQISTKTAAFDHDLIESSLPNFAALFA